MWITRWKTFLTLFFLYFYLFYFLLSCIAFLLSYLLTFFLEFAPSGSTQSHSFPHSFYVCVSIYIYINLGKSEAKKYLKKVKGREIKKSKKGEGVSSSRTLETNGKRRSWHVSLVILLSPLGKPVKLCISTELHWLLTIYLSLFSWRHHILSYIYIYTYYLFFIFVHKRLRW